EQQIAREEHVGHATPPDALLDFVAVVENRPPAVVCHVLPTLLSCASNAPRGYLRNFVYLTSLLLNHPVRSDAQTSSRGPSSRLVPPTCLQCPHRSRPRDPPPPRPRSRTAVLRPERSR